MAFFVYDEGPNEIIFHFSKYGFAGTEIIDGKKVCVSVYKYGKLYTTKRAVDFGCEYQSVVVYGRIQILTSDEERIVAMQIFFRKFYSGLQKIPTRILMCMMHGLYTWRDKN